MYLDRTNLFDGLESHLMKEIGVEEADEWDETFIKGLECSPRQPGRMGRVEAR